MSSQCGFRALLLGADARLAGRAPARIRSHATDQAPRLGLGELRELVRARHAEPGRPLKRREKLTGRLADALSWLLLAASMLRRFEAEGRRAEDLAFASGALELAFRRIGRALEGVRANLKIPGVGWLIRAIPIRGASVARPLRDALDLEIARRMQEPGLQRERIFGGVFVPAEATEPFTQLEKALQATASARVAVAKIRHAIRRGILHPAPPERVAAEACAAGVISDFELEAIRRAELLRAKVIEVDDFSLKNFSAERRAA